MRLVPCVLPVLLLAAVAAQDARRHGPTSPDRGLPRDPAAFRPYHDDPQHVCNRIFRAVWLAELVPAEVAAALPAERGADATFLREGWVHGKRDGTPADRRWFGGDGRQLPVEGLDEPTAKSLRTWLDGLGGAEKALLLDPPELAVFFQHDLLRLAQRLLDTDQNVDLLGSLWRAVQLVALDAGQQQRLRDPLPRALQEPGLQKQFGRDLPPALGGTSDAAFREVLRRSTRLFDAEKTLLWSRVFLAHPDGAEALAELLPKTPAAGEKPVGPHVPVGFRAVLVQGIVALGADGKPYATPVTVDVRSQELRNREPLSATNPTFTRDGIHFGILQLEREGLRRGAATNLFRIVDADDQELFRDYGTLKHTTYRAQCTLCHRTTDTPEPQLGGFPVLRPHVGARFAATGEERLRLAEQQAAKLLAALAAAR